MPSHRWERRAAIVDALRTRTHVTVEEIATRFGISRATAWRDITGLVAAGLGEKVHGGVMRLGLEALTPPSPASVSAGVGNGLALGMQVPDDRRHFERIVEGARQACRTRGTRLLVRTTGYWDPSDVDRAIQDMIAHGAAGLLLTPVGIQYRSTGVPSTLVSRSGLPTLLIERETSGTPDVPSEVIGTDHGSGTFLAVEHLASLGHERVALVTTPERTTTRDQIALGFAKAVADLIPGAGAPHVWQTRSTRPASIMGPLQRASVTGLVVYADRLAMALAAHATEAGLQVPDDLSIVAYGDLVGATAMPALTAVTVPLVETGAEAAHRLIDHLTGRSQLDRRRVQLAPRLIVRDSTAPPRPW